MWKKDWGKVSLFSSTPVSGAALHFKRALRSSGIRGSIVSHMENYRRMLDSQCLFRGFSEKHHLIYNDIFSFFNAQAVLTCHRINNQHRLSLPCLHASVHSAVVRPFRLHRTSRLFEYKKKPNREYQKILANLCHYVNNDKRCWRLERASPSTWHHNLCYRT